MLVEHNQTQTHNPITHKTIWNGGFEIKCLYGGDLSCQEITHLTHGRREQDQLQHLPSISNWDWLRSKLQLIKHNETEENHYLCFSCFHSSQIYYARPMDLLVTWGSNLAESSPRHSMANFSQSGFCRQLIAFGQVSILFSPNGLGFGATWHSTM